MSVTTDISKDTYLGNGAHSTFAFAFKAYLPSDLIVSVEEIATGVSTVLNYSTDYFVTFDGAVPNTGTITLLGGYENLSAAYKITILRSLPYTQLIALADNAKTPAATYQEAFDRAVMLIQQLLEKINRAVLGPVTDDSPITLPTPEAGKYLYAVSPTQLSWRERYGQAWFCHG